MGATCRPDCGGCCDPVTIPYTQAEAHALHDAGEISDDQWRWVTEVLIPMRPKEAKAIAPYLFEGK
jgi:hypothetical protein